MIKTYLAQPYPLTGSKWKIVISISTFIALFMFVFQPFGFSEYNGSNKTSIGLGYGLVTLITLVLDLYGIQYLFKSWFSKKDWTVFRQLTWLIWIIFSIGMGNFIYSSMLLLCWSWNIFLSFQFFTLAIGIIPIIIITILQQNFMLAQNLQAAQEFNSSLGLKAEVSDPDLVCLIADNEKDKLEVESSNVLYIESTGNYIEVFYTLEEKLKNIVLRSTLKRTESQLENHPSFQKCHRAFIVNTNKIIQVKGNSQGLRLALKNTIIEIPVSRNFAKALKEKLNS